MYKHACTCSYYLHVVQTTVTHLNPFSYAERINVKRSKEETNGNKSDQLYACFHQQRQLRCQNNRLPAQRDVRTSPFTRQNCSVHYLAISKIGLRLIYNELKPMGSSQKHRQNQHYETNDRQRNNVLTRDACTDVVKSFIKCNHH